MNKAKEYIKNDSFQPLLLWMNAMLLSMVQMDKTKAQWLLVASTLKGEVLFRCGIVSDKVVGL